MKHFSEYDTRSAVQQLERWQKRKMQTDFSEGVKSISHVLIARVQLDTATIIILLLLRDVVVRRRCSQSSTLSLIHSRPPVLRSTMRATRPLLATQQTIRRSKQSRNSRNRSSFRRMPELMHSLRSRSNSFGSHSRRESVRSSIISIELRFRRLMPLVLTLLLLLVIDILLHRRCCSCSIRKLMSRCRIREGRGQNHRKSSHLYRSESSITWQAGDYDVDWSSENGSGFEIESSRKDDIRWLNGRSVQETIRWWKRDSSIRFRDRFSCSSCRSRECESVIKATAAEETQSKRKEVLTSISHSDSSNLHSLHFFLLFIILINIFSRHQRPRIESDT